MACPPSWMAAGGPRRLELPGPASFVNRRRYLVIVAYPRASMHRAYMSRSTRYGMNNSPESLTLRDACTHSFAARFRSGSDTPLALVERHCPCRAAREPDRRDHQHRCGRPLQPHACAHRLVFHRPRVGGPAPCWVHCTVSRWNHSQEPCLMGAVGPISWSCRSLRVRDPPSAVEASRMGTVCGTVTPH
jgi:hypothetical protein